MATERIKPLELTKQKQVNEIIRCGKDPIHFIRTHARIQHPQRGTIPFETYPFQDECIAAFEAHRFNIVLKSRQLGLSTVSAAYAVWLAIFYKDKNILVIATKLSTAMNFIKKVTACLQGLPPWLLLPKFEPSKQAVSFSNGSQIKAVPTSEDAGRSESISLLIVDEAAWIRDFDDIWTGLYPTLSTGGRVIVISTPNGVGGQYYKLWTEAEAGVNDFNPIKLMWDVHPEHDQAWFDKESRQMSRREVGQELLCDFTTSGDTYLQPDDLERIKSYIRPPMERAGHDRNMWVWAHPIPERQYVMSADVSRGDAHDYSAIHIVDVATCDIVAEYMGKVPPEMLADMMNEWGTRYNTALAVPENNTFGWFVCQRLKILGYKRLYYHDTKKADPFTYVPTNADEKIGFPTDKNTRVKVLAKLERLIREQHIRPQSQRLYDQLLAFVWKGAKPMASRDSYDDLVMSLAIGGWLLDGNEKVNEGALEMTRALLRNNSMESVDRGHRFARIDDVRPLANPRSSLNHPKNVFRPRDASEVKHADLSDFSWLLK